MAEILFDNIKSDFCKYYKFIHGVAYVWTKKDNAQVGNLIRYMNAAHGNKLRTDQVRKEMQLFIKAAFHKAPQWIQNNISVALLSSQFNVIRQHQLKPESSAAGYAKDNYKNNYDRDGHKRKETTTGMPSELKEILKKFSK